MSIHGGLDVLLKESSLWLQVIHCFNYQLELTVKDSFKTTTFEKHSRDAKSPTKTTGTRWIGHKIRAMKIVLKNYEILVAHVKSLSQMGSQQQNRA